MVSNTKGNNMDYEVLFSKLKCFKEAQEEQKKRGLNNYNILSTVLASHDEVRLHSRMLHSFLDPNGEHYQGTLFLDLFLKELNQESFPFNTNACQVYKEYQNIDLYLTDGYYHIIIENKLYACDQDEQIQSYVEKIQNKGAKQDKINSDQIL